MGRDEAVAERLESHTLHVFGQWQNPGLVEKAVASGGQFHIIDSITDTRLIADAVQAIEPDMFFTNFDDSLAAGVVDAIRQRVAEKRMPDLLIPCPDKAAARIEWDKFFLRDLIDEINPGYNPLNFMAITTDATHKAIRFFEAENKELVIKPRNLSGGKGVKVMGKHFEGFDEARAYATQVLAAPDQTGIEIQEKLEGHEFTLQIFTDGTTMVRPPATYDYPYREDGDTGPGTGGMGAFSMPAGQQLPFIDESDYEEAMALMEKVLDKLKDRELDYKGVLYPTFFKTTEGLKIVEINARGGDPELINIVDLMEDDIDLADVLTRIAQGELSEDSVRYKKLASAMIYLVSPDYGYRKGPPYAFNFDPKIAGVYGCHTRFAATEKIGKNYYRSVGSSRTVGLSALGNTPWDARQKIHDTIAAASLYPLQFLQNIADKNYIENLAK